jgi:hypothetical protein
MPYTVALPDGRSVEFPDDVSKEQAGEILRKQFGGPETTVAGNVKEFFRGVVPGAVGLVEGAVTGASAMLPEEYEKAARGKTKEVAGTIKAPFAAAPGYEESVGRKLGEGVGSTLPLFAMGPLGIAGRVGMVGTGIAAGAGEARVRAEESGATAEQRKLSTLGGAAIGSTESLPVFSFLSKIGKPASDAIFARIRRALITGGEEGAQEAATQALQNAVAKGVYKPEQAIIEGTGEAGAYGAGVGIIIDMALGRRAKGTKSTPAEETQINQAIAARAAKAEADKAKAEAEAAAGAPTVTKKGRKGKATAVAPGATVEDQSGVAGEASTILDEAKLTAIGVKKNNNPKSSFSALNGTDTSNPAELPKILAILKNQVKFYTGKGDTARVATLQAFIDDLTPVAEAPVADDEINEQRDYDYIDPEEGMAPAIVRKRAKKNAPVAEAPGELTTPYGGEGSLEATAPDLTSVTPTTESQGVSNVTESDGESVGTSPSVASETSVPATTGGVTETQPIGVVPAESNVNGSTGTEGQQPAALEALTAARDRLKTPSGKVPAPKSKARKQYDALQSEIDLVDIGLNASGVKDLNEQKYFLQREIASDKKSQKALRTRGGALLPEKQSGYDELQSIIDQNQLKLDAVNELISTSKKNAKRRVTSTELGAKNVAWFNSKEAGEVNDVDSSDALIQRINQAVGAINNPKSTSNRVKLSSEYIFDTVTDPQVKAGMGKAHKHALKALYYAVDPIILKSSQRAEYEALVKDIDITPKERTQLNSEVFNISQLDAAIPTTEEFIAAVATGSTRKALQAVLKDSTTNPLIKLVVQRLLKGNTLPKLSVVPAGTLGEHLTDPTKFRVGEYNAVTDTIRLDERAINGPNLIHEVVHGFLHRKVVDYMHGYKDGQVKRIDDLYQYLKASHPELIEQYGMTDLSEFTSEATSNPEFQKALNVIPYKKSSFYSAFAEAVLKFFGINSTNKQWNALTEALISVESAMQSGRALQEVRTGTEVQGPDTAPNISTPGAVAAAAAADIIGVASDPTLTERAKQILGAKRNRSYFADKLVSIDRKLFAGYGGKLFDSLGDIIPSELLAQALDAPRVVERAFFEGFLKLTPDGMFTAAKGELANGEEASLISIFKIIQDSTKQTGKTVEEERKNLSAMLVGHREFELDAYNNLPTTVVGIELRISDPAKRNELERQFQANPDAQKILKIMDAMRFNRIDMMVTSGRISQDKADFWKSTSGYIPFQDINALESMIATQKTGPTKGLAKVAKYNPIKGAADVQVGDSIDAFIGLIANMGVDAIKTNAVSKASQALTMLGHAKRISPVQPLNQQEKQHTVDTYVNGVPARYYFNDPLDAAAFAGMPSEISTVTAIMHGFSRGLRASVTLAPGFGVAQVLMDITRAYAVSDVAHPAALIPRILLNFPRAAFGELTGRKSKAVIRMENMGVAATFDTSTSGTIKSVLQQVGAQKRSIGDYILHAAESISKGSDLAVRQAIYQQSMKETKGNEALSISRAREIINFSRRGNAKFVDFLVRTVPFTNAYIRGMDKLYTAATGKGNMYGMTQAEARGMFRNRILTLSAIGFTYALMMAGDDEYESLDESIRDSHIIIPGIKFGDTPLAIPLPKDLAFIFKAIPERVVNYFRKYGTDEEKGGIRVIGELMKQGFGVVVAPNAIPIAALPVLENITNYSFFLDRALESQAQLNQSAFLRSGRGTSELAKAASTGLKYVSDELRNVGLDGKAIEVSPIKLENLFRGLLGTSATLALAMSDELLAPDRTEKNMKRSVLAQITGASALMIDPVGKRQTNALYELHDRVDAVRKDMETLEKNDPMAAIEYGQKHIAEINVYPYVNILFKELQERNKEIKMIDAEKSLTPKERMEAIAKVIKEQNDASKDVDRINSMMAKG